MRKIILAVATAASLAGSASYADRSVNGNKLGYHIGKCWNVGSLSTDALRTDIVVHFTVDEGGKFEVGSVILHSSRSQTKTATKQAYQAARRAIIRCLAGRTLKGGIYPITFEAHFAVPQGVSVRPLSDFLTET